MQGHKIAGCTDRRHVSQLTRAHAAAISDSRAVLKHHIHAEPEMRTVGNRPPDPAHANNPQCLATQRPPDQMRRPPPGPFACAQLAFSLAGTPTQHQHQGHRNISSGIGQDTGRVRNRYVMSCCRGQIDMVDTNTIIGNQAAAACSPGSNDLGIYPV